MSDLAPGTTLGPFRIERVRGKGGMATVYEAYERGVLERLVALKVLPPEFLHDETFASRFAQEARFAAALAHANIVPIHATGIDEGIPWMSMRLLNGGTVADLLTQNPKGLGVERTTKILRGVAEALDYAHGRGVIHRDIKPSNILLDEDGRAYISDFGIARLMEGADRITRTRTTVGTPDYMAPEQWLGVPLDARCDIYSLGVVAYEMLTGAPPFRGSGVAVLKQHACDPIPMPARTLVSDAQFDVLNKALAKKPGDRWQSAGQFVAELSSAGHETSTGEKRRLHSVVVRWAWVTTGLCAALFVLWSRTYINPTPPPVQQPAQTSGSAAEVVQPVPSIPRDTNAERPSQLPPVPRTTPPVRTSPTSQAGSSSLPQAKPLPPPAPDEIDPQPTTGQDATAKEPDTPRPTAEVVVSPPVLPKQPAEPASDVIVEPKKIGTITPDYPRNALVTKIEGDVRLQAVILPDGRVTGVRVLNSPNAALNNAAVRAVQQSTYEPGLRNGKPDTFTIEVTVRFRLP